MASTDVKVTWPEIPLDDVNWYRIPTIIMACVSEELGLLFLVFMEKRDSKESSIPPSPSSKSIFLPVGVQPLRTWSRYSSSRL